MGKKNKPYKIESKDEDTNVYGNFSLSDIKRLANALIADIDATDKKDDDRKDKKTLFKRLKKLIDD